MSDQSIRGVAVISGHGEILAHVGPPSEDWRGDEAARVPLPDGGYLAVLPAVRGDAWPRFARAFAHEARSPLNALGIYLELLAARAGPSEGKPGTSPERLLAKAQEQIRRLDELLRIFSDLWAPRGDVADLSAIARSAARFAEHEAIRRGLRFTRDICESACVSISPSGLAEAFVAALDGVLQAPAESMVVLRAQRSDQRDKVQVAIAVSSSESEIPAGLLDAGLRAFAALGAQVDRTGSTLSATFETCLPSDEPIRPGPPQ